MGACNNDVTAATSAVILDHPCYHTSRRDHVVSESLLSRGKRRADGCPVCSSLGGVGYAIAKAAPCFASPVSMLLCRGSGALMTHDNPPMALPNGQVILKLNLRG